MRKIRSCAYQGHHSKAIDSRDNWMGHLIKIMLSMIVQSHFLYRWRRRHDDTPYLWPGVEVGDRSARVEREVVP